MDTDAKGQLGGMDSPEEVRKRLAGQSRVGKCAVCGKTNEEIMREQDENVKAVGAESVKTDEVPEELRLAYRDDLKEKEKSEEKKAEGAKDGAVANGTAPAPAPAPASDPIAREPAQQPTPTPTRPASGPAPVPPAVAASAAQQQQRQRAQQDDGVPAWIDKAIYGIVAALAFLILKRLL